jgi:F1F0 ATPase subunit 2
MTDIVTMVTIFFAGLTVGGFFFAGLFWTVERGLSAKHPGLLFLGSFSVRIAVVLVSFYFLSAGQWERLLVCAAGFFIARIILIRFAGTAAETSGSRREVGDAPQSR